MARRQHLKVRTSDVERTPDMVRYISYAEYGTRPDRSTDYDLKHLIFQPETPEPVRVKWAGSSVTIHRFSETVRRVEGGQIVTEDWTYFRLPSVFNTNWISMGIARWRSFGIVAVSEMR